MGLDIREREETPEEASRNGILSALIAYSLWGFLPLYWKALLDVPAGEILANRIVWSFVFVVLLLTLRRNWHWLKPALRQRRVLLTFTATAQLLGINYQRSAKPQLR